MFVKTKGIMKEKYIERIRAIEDIAEKSKQVMESVKALGFDQTTIDLSSWVHGSIEKVLSNEKIMLLADIDCVIRKR